MTWRDTLPIHPAAELFPLVTGKELEERAANIRENGLRVPVAILRTFTEDGVVYELLDGRSRLDAIELALGRPLRWVEREVKIKRTTRTCIGFEVEDDNGKPVFLHDLKVTYPEVDDDTGEEFQCVDCVIKPPAKDLCDINNDYHEFYEDVDPWALVASLNLHRRHLDAEQKRELIAKLIKAEPEKSNRAIADTVNVDHKTVGAARRELEGRGEIPHVEKHTDSKGRKQPAKKKKKHKPAHLSAAVTAKAKALIEEIGIDVVRRVLTALDEPHVLAALREEVLHRAMNGAAAENIEDHWIESETL